MSTDEPTLFDKIIQGDIPAHIVWSDPVCVAFLVVDPMTDGHVVVVPRRGVDQWLDADPGLVGELMRVAQIIGLAQRAEWDAARVGVMIEGFAVPHLHVHIWPANGHDDFDVHNVTHGQDQQVLRANADRLRSRLHADGHEALVPTDD